MTKGKGAITESYCVDQQQKLMFSQLAALQSGSKHPIAQTIKAYCTENIIPLFNATDIKAVNGEGIQGNVAQDFIVAGNQKMMQRFSIMIPETLIFQATQSIVYIARNGYFLGFISISDELRENSIDAIAELQNRGLNTVMLSGDKRSVVEHIAQQLNINQSYSELKPKDKLAKLIELQQSNNIAMVGDGVNDAPALAQADVSIAMGTGSDAAKESASITLMRNDPRLIATAIDISKATWRKIQQNLFWAFIFNTIAIPAAALGYLSPAIAGAAMAFSSIAVLTNSLLLKKIKIKELT